MEKKIAIITGGTRGIGYATSKKFLEEGYTVVALSIDSEELVNTVVEEMNTVGEFKYIRCNVANKEECKAAVEKVVAEYGKVDVLANVAGVVGERKDLVDANLEDI